LIEAHKVRSKKEAEVGFTLLEVIVAISILSVGLLAVATMQTAAIRDNDNAYRVTESTTWAQDRLEALTALPYSDAALSIGDDKADPVSPTPAGYTITYNVEAGPIANTKKITVFVTPTAIGFAKKKRSLSCVKGDL
jgi:prepilin-type N-terminal cleavage/methylation domain-containing protein